MKSTTAVAVLAGLLSAAPALLQANVRTPKPPENLASEVRHELVMLPYYGVFDNLAYQVDGHDVTLYGQVTRPTLKADAGRVVKRIPGVETVVNRIEVLPLSPMDDRVRLGALRAIYRQSSLSRYALSPQAPIRIIVRNGNLTLEGVVDSAFDRNLAGIEANQVFGAFSVTNNLRIAKS